MLLLLLFVQGVLKGECHLRASILPYPESHAVLHTTHCVQAKPTDAVNVSVQATSYIGAQVCLLYCC